MSSLKYFVKLADGSLIRAEQNGALSPTPVELMALFANMTFESGATYNLHMQADNVTIVVNHLSLSTPEFRRAAEALPIFVEGRISEESFAAISAALEARIRATGMYSVRLLWLH